MRRVMDVRKQLGFRTIFNLIGPLANPARVKHQLIGVSNEKLVPIFSKVANLLGIERAIIVCGKDGMDEITVTSSTTILCNFYTDLGDLLSKMNYAYSLEDIKGGDANYNATALRKMLLGDGTGAFAEAARVNAAAGLIVSGEFTDFGLAYAATKQAIESRKAYDILHQVMAITNEHT
jgi:anthranilate phosphoribosyltransferase